ncbi:MAG: PLP-dependent aminotransferase family protein [Thiotrichaceae bacterium]|nr:PLP-dependent aminotransferase family protein [Thiotrichaceae bacterium]
MRRAKEIELAIAPKPADASLQQWLYGELRAAILSGRLKPTVRLPTSRDFARQQGISRGTVLAVYAQLTAEGYLQGKVGSGTRVSACLPNLENVALNSPNPSIAAHRGKLSERGQILANSPFPKKEFLEAVRPFCPNQPDLNAFPLRIWNKIASQRSHFTKPALMLHGDSQGYFPLRRAIAEHLRYSQRIHCHAEQVMILGSAQQALDLCARLLLNPDDQVWLEEPGYPGAKQVFEMAGGQIIPVAVDEYGMNITAGIAAAPHARLAYVTAAHQSPLGMSLSLERRLALLQWAEAQNAMIIEDDYDSEFRYLGTPLAALKSLDDKGRVIYMGTFSKLLFPALRLAYVVVPEWLTDAFASAISLTCRHISLQTQLILRSFIEEGHFARHLRHMRLLYGERAAVFQQVCVEHLGEWLSILPITTGLDATALLASPFQNDVEVANRLIKAGIEARPLSFYRIGTAPACGLVLGFSAFDAPQLQQGVHKMRAVFEEK